MGPRNIAGEMERSGWPLAARSDRSVLVSDDPGGRYVLAAYVRRIEAERAVFFELYDRELDVLVYVREVPDPARAPDLLRSYGVPASWADAGHARPAPE